MPIIALRLALYLLLGLLTGTGLFSLYALAPAERARLALPAIPVALLALAGVAASLLGFWVGVADMMGTGLGDVDGETLVALLQGSAYGWAFAVRSAALLAAAALALLLRRRPTALAVSATVLGGVALATLAWNGHAAASEGSQGWLHLGADIVHTLAASAWLGALLMFLRLLWPARRPDDRLLVARRALGAFARTGSLIVALLIVTGAVNAVLILGPAGLPSVPATPYGRLLLAKLACFAGMLGLAALNRFRLTPALVPQGSTDGARLRRSILLELGLLLLILALVAALGTLEPLGAAPGN